MNTAIRETEATKVPEQPVSTQAAPEAPTLEAVVQAIRQDAKYDSMKFVLRSDTGHDGE